MSPRVLAAATFGSALGCGLVSGVFFAFSSFVMPALARLAPASGVAAMQAINVAAFNRWFAGALLGTAAVCAALAASAPFAPPGSGAGLRLGGALVYLAGAIGVTAACNIPLNDALAAVSPDGAEAAGAWQHYLGAWCRWNHLRAAASLAAAALLTLSLLGEGRSP